MLNHCLYLDGFFVLSCNVAHNMLETNCGWFKISKTKRCQERIINGVINVTMRIIRLTKTHDNRYERYVLYWDYNDSRPIGCRIKSGDPYRSYCRLHYEHEHIHVYVIGGR